MLNHCYRKMTPGALLLIPLLVALAASGCSKSPTAPSQGGGTTPPPPSSSTWNITVTANPSSLEVGATAPATVTVNVRRASDNSKPSNGTTIGLSTTLGSFDPNNQVQNGGAELFDGQVNVPLYAGGTPGTASVRATLQGSVGSTGVNISGTSNFFIESISPSTGSPSGGDTVRIRGGGFIAPVQVTFGGFPADVLDVTSSIIRVRTPPAQVPVGGVSSVAVNVTRDAGGENPGTVSLANGYTYTTGSVTGPQLYSVAPTSGPNEGGTRVTIRGDGFQAPVQVFFNGGAQVEAQVESVSSTQIVAIAPAATGFGQPNLNQNVSIEVRNVNSGQLATLQGAYRYGVSLLITSLGPGQGPYYGGTMVTIFGQGFDEPVAVQYGGYAQQVVSVTGTEILSRSASITTSSCQDVSGPVSVTNVESGASGAGPSFTYQVVAYSPRVSSITPSSGAQGGGTTVTVNGSNFFEPMVVSFDERRGTIQSISENQIVVTTPGFPTESLATENCDAGGGATGVRYIPTFVDVAVSSQATTCADTLVEGFAYSPSDPSCRVDTSGGGTDPASPPVADFTYQVNAGAVDSTVIFTDASTDAASWVWDFDAGLSPVGANPATHTGKTPPPVTYAGCNAGSPCTATVSLKVTGPGGTDEILQFVDIPQP